mmetsp:Transcript_3298/g.5678  ORF Transcript_3298/g.5678 Transcript_3298/m.5678 type:complete len:99 (-) Transcript_3298:441-737(-)
MTSKSEIPRDHVKTMFNTQSLIFNVCHHFRTSSNKVVCFAKVYILGATYIDSHARLQNEIFVNHAGEITLLSIQLARQASDFGIFASFVCDCNAVFEI